MAVSLLGAILVSGCLSVPISTLYHLKKMVDNDELKNMDPAQFRTAVELPDNVPIDPSKIVVGFCFHKGDHDSEGDGGAWPIELVRKGRFVTAALPIAAEGRTLYLLRFSDDAQTRLGTILTRWRADNNAYQTIDIDIRLTGGNPPPEVKSYRTSGWFQTSIKDGYYQLLDDYKVDVEAIEKNPPDEADRPTTSMKNCH